MPPAKKTSLIHFSYTERGFISPVGELWSKDGGNTISLQTVKRVAKRISDEDDVEIKVTWIPDKQRSITTSKPAVISVVTSGSAEDGFSTAERFSEIATEEGLS